MLALLPLALSVLPGIIDLIAGDKAGKVAGSVASAVAAVAGTSDPAAAQAVLADPAKATELRARLADIALETRRLELADVQDARKMGSTVSLVAVTQVAGFGAVFLLWAVQILTLLYKGVPPSGEQTVFFTVLGTVTGVLGGMTQFFYGNSTAAHAANKRLDKLADQAATAPVSVPVPVPTYLPPPPPPPEREPVPQDTPADELNARELGETPKPRVRVPASSAAAASARFDAALDVTLPEEGGFANHPRDKGGPTQMGITYRTLAAWREVDPAAITVEDVRALKREDVRPIYNANYWLANRCDQMAPGVDVAMFDFCVNSGRAVKVIQDMLGVKVDGRVGPVTLAALAALPAAEAVNRICDARLAYVRTLDDWDAFGSGWTIRIGRVRAKALAMAGG